MNYTDIIAYWLQKWRYIHPIKLRKAVICCEREYIDAWNYCCSPYCQKHAYRWSKKHMNKILNINPEYKLTRLILPVGDILPPYILQMTLENYIKKLRRKYPALEYYWVLELSDNLHYHLLLATVEDIERDFINSKWVKTLKKRDISICPKTIKFQEVYDLPGMANYNTKETCWDISIHRPPKGLYRNLAYGSRGWKGLLEKNFEVKVTI